MNAEDGQVSLFGPDGCAGRTCPAHSAQGPQKGRTSASSSKKLSELRAIPYMFMDLTPGHGDLLGNSYWEILSPWLGGSSILNTGPAPLSGDGASTLSSILEAKPHRKYYLSRTACLGILRRAETRGKELPSQLELALMAQTGLIALPQSILSNLIAFAANQRDEVRDLRNIAGALSAQPGMKQQTFVAGFSAGAGPSAGNIGYQEELSPTLKASSSGNMMPTVLCLNDQGGSIMECSEDVTGTLRAQEHGHQPLVIGVQQEETAEEILPRIELFENHGIDSRYTGPHPVSPTLSCRAGTGGNNLPIMLQEQPATYSRQWVDKFISSAIASTESARQHKDATDLICQEVEWPLLIRRLTPLECERLQGYPDHFTDLPGASDSARYRALGNSVSIPCVEYIMRGFAMAAGA